VFSGRTPDYAQLLAMPPNIDVVTPDIEPGTAEIDPATDNPRWWISRAAPVASR